MTESILYGCGHTRPVNFAEKKETARLMWARAASRTDCPECFRNKRKAKKAQK